MLTEKTMTVAEAREALRDTSRMSSERMAELQAVVDAFHRQRPTKRCAACGGGMWSEHSDAGTPVWGCARCHRPASLTREAWDASQAPAMAAWSQKAAAVQQVVAEEWDAVIKATAAAKAAYIEGCGELRWLLKSGRSPSNDARAARLLAEIDIPISRLPEAAAANGARLEAKVAYLMLLSDE